MSILSHKPQPRTPRDRGHCSWSLIHISAGKHKKLLVINLLFCLKSKSDKKTSTLILFPTFSFPCQKLKSEEQTSKLVHSLQIFYFLTRNYLRIMYGIKQQTCAPSNLNYDITRNRVIL